MAFLTGSQLILLYDEKRVRQLLADSGTPVAGGLDDNPVMVELIAGAQSEMLSAAETGERYDERQLQALIDNVDNLDPPPIAAALIRRLVADLTFAALVSRRGNSAAELDRLCPRYRQAQMMLEQLRMGHRVFPGVEEAETAGLPHIGNTDPSRNPNRPITFTQQARRVFPWSPDRNCGSGGYYGGCC